RLQQAAGELLIALSAAVPTTLPAAGNAHQLRSALLLPASDRVRAEEVLRAGDEERHELLLRAGHRVQVQHLLRSLHGLPAEGLHALYVVPVAEPVQFGDELRRAVRDGASHFAQAGDVPTAG